MLETVKCSECVDQRIEPYKSYVLLFFQLQWVLQFQALSLCFAWWKLTSFEFWYRLFAKKWLLSKSGINHPSIHQSIHVIICPVTHYKRRGLWHIMFSHQCDKMCSNICTSDSSANKRDTHRVIRIVMNNIRAIKNNETAQWLIWSAPVTSKSLNFIIILLSTECSQFFWKFDESIEW